MPCRRLLFALIIIFLFHAPLVLGRVSRTYASSVPPDTRSAVTPEAPPEACRDCAGLRYYRPMKKSEKAKTLDPRSEPVLDVSNQGSGMTEKSKDEKQDGAPLSRQGRGESSGASGAPSNGPADVPAPASPGGSHLSSDSRVNTARVLVERQRSCRGPGDPAPPWCLTIRTRRTCGFSSAWPQAGGHRPPGLKTRNADRAPGPGHRGVPVHPDPPARVGSRAP